MKLSEQYRQEFDEIKTKNDLIRILKDVIDDGKVDVETPSDAILRNTENLKNFFKNVSKEAIDQEKSFVRVELPDNAIADGIQPLAISPANQSYSNFYNWLIEEQFTVVINDKATTQWGTESYSLNISW
jgi:hypothetical protein